MASRSRPPSPMIKLPVEDDGSSSSDVDEREAPSLASPPKPTEKKPANRAVTLLQPAGAATALPGTPQLRDRYNVNSPRRPPRKRPSEHSVGPEQVAELDSDDEPAFDWGDAADGVPDEPLAAEAGAAAEQPAAPSAGSAAPARSSAPSAGQSESTSAGNSSGAHEAPPAYSPQPAQQPVAAAADGETSDATAADVPSPSFVTQVSRDGTPARAPATDDEEEATAHGGGRTAARRPSAFLRCFSCLLPSSKKPTGLRALNGAHTVTEHHTVPVPEALGLLQPLPPGSKKKTLVLDLDETLVHSSFALVDDADFVVDIRIDRSVHKVYVRKRPGVDEFLRALAERFDLVLFTASLPVYADPLLDILDPDGLFSIRLFRDSCVNHHQIYIKDLSKLGRPLDSMCLIDNSPQSFLWHPGHAIPIESWFEDRSDTQLYELVPFLNDVLYHQNDFSDILDGHRPMNHIFRQVPGHLRWTPDQLGVGSAGAAAPAEHHDEPHRQVGSVTLNADLEDELEVPANRA